MEQPALRGGATGRPRLRAAHRDTAIVRAIRRPILDRPHVVRANATGQDSSSGRNQALSELTIRLSFDKADERIAGTIADVLRSSGIEVVGSSARGIDAQAPREVIEDFFQVPVSGTSRPQFAQEPEFRRLPRRADVHGILSEKARPFLKGKQDGRHRVRPDGSQEQEGIATDGEFRRGPRPNAAQAFTPGPKQAQRAQVELARRSVTAFKTPENQLEVSMSAQQFTEMFGVKVTRVPSAADAAPKAIERVTKHETFMLPKAELAVPDWLKDTIDFAYVPRPVEYHAVSLLPPMERNFHLRLESVAHAVNAARCHRRGWTGRGVRVAMTELRIRAAPLLRARRLQRRSACRGRNAEKDRLGTVPAKVPTCWQWRPT